MDMVLGDSSILKAKLQNKVGINCDNLTKNQQQNPSQFAKNNRSSVGLSAFSFRMSLVSTAAASGNICDKKVHLSMGFK